MYALTITVLPNNFKNKFMYCQPNEPFIYAISEEHERLLYFKDSIEFNMPNKFKTFVVVNIEHAELLGELKHLFDRFYPESLSNEPSQSYSESEFGRREVNELFDVKSCW